MPIRELAGFSRIHLQPGEIHRVYFTVRPEQLYCTHENGSQAAHPGKIRISVGGGQPDQADAAANVPGVSTVIDR
jgi:beta-glucosidase